MEDRWAPLREAATILSVALFIAFVGGLFLWPEMRTQQFWINDRGWLEVLPGIGAVTAASGAWFVSVMNYRLSQGKDVSDRFQKGVEMLEDGSNAKKNAGIIVLEDIALTKPGSRYDGWVREFLVSAIEDWSTASRNKVPTGSTIGHTFERSNLSVLRALQALARLPVWSERPKFISYLYLATVRISKVDLSSITISFGDIYNTDFVDCVATNLTFRSRFFREINFRSSTMRRAKIHATLLSRCELNFSECDLTGTVIFCPSGSTLKITACEVDGVQVRGRGTVTFVRSWFYSSAPSITSTAVFGLDGKSGIFRPHAKIAAEVGSAFQLWEPGEFDVEVPVEPLIKEPIVSQKNPEVFSHA